MWMVLALGHPHHVQQPLLPAMPRHSDVLFTTRTAHYTKVTGKVCALFIHGISLIAVCPCCRQGAGSGLYDSFEAAAAFHSTAAAWVYSTNASFVQDLHRRGGLRSVQLAINPQVPDTNTTDSFKIGRVQNVHGEPLVAPWLDFGNRSHFYGCVNNPAYKAIAFARVAALVRAGASSIQHDDPTSNLEATLWHGGDPTKSGCYCPVCMAGFTSRLLTMLNSSELARLNISEGWRYNDFLVSGKPHGTSAAAELRAMFVAYQTNNTVEYIEELRGHLPASVPLSCNNGGRGLQDHPVYRLFDMGLGELSSGSANPGGLKQVFVDQVPRGKLQIMTMPKNQNVTFMVTGDVALTRASIAMAYALGSSMLVPWDIYIPSDPPAGKRFYGSAAEFGDLYGFVRAQAGLLDSMSSIAGYESALAGTELKHTGEGGDGMRWRLPIDKGQAAIGRIVDAGHSAGSCAWHCRVDVQCKGFFAAASSCYLLYELHVVNNTSIVGNSYALKPNSNATAVVWSDDTLLATTLRVPASPSLESAQAALHVVDWANATGSTRNATAAHVFVRNEAVCGGSGACGGLARIAVAAPSLPEREIPPEDQACHQGVTRLRLPSRPAPWCIVRLACRGP